MSVRHHQMSEFLKHVTLTAGSKVHIQILPKELVIRYGEHELLHESTGDYIRIVGSTLAVARTFLTGLSVGLSVAYLRYELVASESLVRYLSGVESFRYPEEYHDNRASCVVCIVGDGP